MQVTVYYYSLVKGREVQNRHRGTRWKFGCVVTAVNIVNNELSMFACIPLLQSMYF